MCAVGGVHGGVEKCLGAGCAIEQCVCMVLCGVRLGGIIQVAKVQNLKGKYFVRKKSLFLFS